MNKAVLLIGGNQGDRKALLQQATELIRQRVGSVVRASAVYETAPWGEFEVENPKLKIENFLNQALLVETELTAHEVLHEALAIEKELGRETGKQARLSEKQHPILQPYRAPHHGI